MNYAFEVIRKTRVNVLKMVDGLSIEQLNKIPEGFNNNLIWNIGHLIAAQQNICYKRAGLHSDIDEVFFNTYKSDTKPEGNVEEGGFEQIKRLLVSTIDQLELDYNSNAFAGYKPWTVRYNFEINNIDEAIAFLPFHEGLHTGYIMALKRALNR
ncbi:DinB family protein [Mucilaginibacter jinjuensis]|uniref:DinB family protein n=1 Tax=Mucilaginibacter jinjuensis TaxID=1176721 RepID=A0ABY7T1D6_9SPHI|nr:DinB family protein [Mucilaginibacter jinjuensis]WCT10039.1 DinB family protein [Mucilaginibacter jinjuensis]